MSNFTRAQSIGTMTSHGLRLQDAFGLTSITNQWLHKFPLIEVQIIDFNGQSTYPDFKISHHHQKLKIKPGNSIDFREIH